MTEVANRIASVRADAFTHAELASGRIGWERLVPHIGAAIPDLDVMMAANGSFRLEIDTLDLGGLHVVWHRSASMSWCGALNILPPLVVA